MSITQKAVNIPSVKLGIVSVSTNWFPAELSINRRKSLVEAYTRKYGQNDIYECPFCVIESELYIKKVLRDLAKAECNALCIYLGDFGPENAASMLAQQFDGPVMLCAASEESQDDLIAGRGDALSGLLNANYSLRMRKQDAFIPTLPVGDAGECAEYIHTFLPVARAVIGIRNLKIISFGPRPANMPSYGISPQPFYDLGVEIEDNSELDLLDAFKKHEGDSRIPTVATNIADELELGNQDSALLAKFAQYELTLSDWIRTHAGSRKYVALTNRCFPLFASYFGFVPCYENSRFTRRGIPISCEMDLYGALSEYIGLCVSESAVTILNINNTVPQDMFCESIEGREFNGKKYVFSDTFMGYHCGNTQQDKLTTCTLKNQYIMSRTLPAEVTNGTIQGDIVPGEVTLFRLQGTLNSKLNSYVAQGQVLPVPARTYGGVGVFAVPEMARFYRNVLIEKSFPNHVAVVFGHWGKQLIDVFRYLGLSKDDVHFNRPKSFPYPSENPYELFEGWY